MKAAALWYGLATFACVASVFLPMCWTPLTTFVGALGGYHGARAYMEAKRR